MPEPGWRDPEPWLFLHKRSRGCNLAAALLPAGLWSMEPGMRDPRWLLPSTLVCTERSRESSTGRGWECEAIQSRGRQLPARAVPRAPHTAGAPRGLHSTATTHRERGGRAELTLPPLPSTLLGSVPPLTPPPAPGLAPAPRCPAALPRAGIDVALVFPLPWRQHNPPLTSPGLLSFLITATTQTPAFTIFLLPTSKGQDFTGLLRKSQPSPAWLHASPTKVLELENPGGAAAANMDFIIQPCPRSRSS